MRGAFMAIAALVTLLSARTVSADPRERPHDVPAGIEESAFPPLPPEYLSHQRGGIRFSYHPSARDRVRRLMEQTGEIRDELAAALGQAVLATAQVRIAVNGADLDRILPAGSPLGSELLVFGDAGIVAISLQSLRSPDGSSLDELFRRGLAQLALDEVTAHGAELPRWFRVGFGHRFGREGSLARSRALWWGAMRDELIPLADLERRLEASPIEGGLAEAQAIDLIRYLGEGDRRAMLHDLLVRVGGGEPFDDALRGAYRSEPADIEQLWREDLDRRHAIRGVLLAGASLAVAVGLFLLARRAWKRRRPATKPAQPVHRSPSTAEREAPPEALPLHVSDAHEGGVPKIAHDGRWHTLH